MYRVSYQGRMVLWVSEKEHELQARLMLCAHMQDAGHRGVRATTHRLGAYCAWDDMDNDIVKSSASVYIRKRAMLYHVHWAI